ncbi:MAG: DUF1614 domain-containing protein [Hyphomicrobiaceae bacterium]
MHYFPITGTYFSVLLFIVLALVVLIQIQALQYAYERLGIPRGVAALLLVACLLGSYVNIPIAHLPEKEIVSGQVVTVFGSRYVIPVVRDWPGTVIAVNVGGALIPIVTSIYLIVRNGLWITAPIAVAALAALSYALAKPVPGLGIAVPVFVPALAAAAVALLLSRRHAAPLAYIGGSIGTLVGADLLNLGRIQGLGAPIASIGGAGTFDGVFITGIVAVLLASIPWRDRSVTSS